MLAHPYKLVEAEQPGRIGFRIEYFDEVGSTQQVAARLAEGGAIHGTVVIGERQSTGRGRLGRSWHSPSGVNLYSTIILRPRMGLGAVPQLNLVAGVALAEALETVAAGLVALKWPNDVWLKRRKAGGIIAEAVADAAQRLLCVLLGIGVNLNLAADELPPELRDKATSVLIATGRTCDRVQFAQTLFERLDTRYEEALAGGFAAIRPTYERYFALRSRRVTVSDGDSQLSGVIRGIDHDGALLLESGLGLRRILAGDVSVEGAYD